jgi:Ca2+-binding RTX toxin-like protein
MNHVHHHRIRHGLLAGCAAIAVGLAGGAAAAQAQVPCVVGPGVTQTDTTVVGSAGNDTIDCGGASPGKTITGGPGNDTITGTASNDVISGGDGNDTLTGGAGDDALDGGLGIDTISGSDGADSLIGPSNDGSQDSLDGGLNIDTCQGPAPDPDIHASCENTLSPPISGPGSSTSNAGELCARSGGLFVDLSPVDYSCVFVGVPIKKQRRPEADRICTRGGGTFLNVTSLLYTCVLP